MKKLKFSNKFKIIFSVLVIGIILPIFIVCAFYRPTTLNKYIVNKLYNEPVNNYFTDQNFYNCVIDAYNDENKTSYAYTYNLSDEELSSINELTCSDSSIIDTVGLEKLTSLTYLSLQHIFLKELDVNNNVALKYLHVKENQLTELDVSKNILLMHLDVTANQLTKLDVSKNTALTELDVYANELTELDVSKNTALTKLNVSSNELTELDVSKNTSLVEFIAYYNQLSELDVSKNTALTKLNAFHNKLTELDVSKNVLLMHLDVTANQLTELDVSKNTALTELGVSDIQLTELDVSKNTSLTKLYVYDNQLTELDVSKNTSLIKLYAYDNQLTELDVSKNTKLTELWAFGNKLTELDVSKNLALTKLYAGENQLTELDVSKNTALTELYVYNNQLTELDVSKNTALTELAVLNNQLTELDVSKNIALTKLSVSDNNFQNKKIVYINKLSNITPPPVIPLENKSNVITSYNVNNNSNITIDKENNTIISSKAGEYNLKLSYEYNYYSDKNASYDVDYTLYVAELTSTKYGIDNTNSIIYVPHNEVIDKNIINNLHTNYGTIEFSDNKIKIKDNDKVIEEFTIEKIKLNTSNNKIKIQDDYIYTTLDKINNTHITSNFGTININNNTLEVKYNNIIIDSYNIVISIKFNDYQIVDNILIIPNELTYEEFTNNITTNGVTYKIYNGEEEVTTGNIVSDMILNIYNDDVLIDSYILKSINITSGLYTLTDDYLYIGTSTLDLTKLETNIGTLRENNNNLEVVYNDVVCKTIPIIKISSDNYVIKGDDIYAFNEDLDINKISSTNASFEIDNDLLKLVYNDTILKTYNIKKVTISSDKYLIKDSNIYVNGTFDITKISVTNATLNVNGNKLELLINNEVIKEYDIVEFTVTSDIYEIIDKYVYSYNLDVNPNYITASIGEVVIDNDTVKIMYNDTTIDTYKFIYVNSDEYKIGSDYVFVSNSTFSLSKISSNGTLSINNSKLELKDNDVVLKSFDITSIDFGDLRVSDKIITLNEEMSYSDFIKNITTTGVTYKIEKDVTTSTDDPKYEEITSGNITGGLLLRVYKNDEIIAYYSINEGYYRIIDTSVKVDQIRAYISNVKDRLTVEQIKQIVETSGTITILDKEDNVKESTLLVGTGDKIKIDLGNDRIFTYTLIVKGDVDGDGEVTTIDALNIVNHILGRDELKDIYLKAGNVDEDDEMSTIDALNIVNYILGKESSL